MRKLARWRDPRLLIGIVLVVGSVLAGAWILDSNTNGKALYIAKSDLPAGTTITAEQVEVIYANPNTATYLPAGELPAGGTVLRSIGAGELIPAAAIGSAAQAGQRVVIPLAQKLPASTGVGERIDLYYADRQSEAGQLVAAGAVIVGITNEGGLRAATQVEVNISPAELPQLVATLAKDGVITAVATTR